MPRYLVRWSAELDAPTAHDVAARAIAQQRRKPSSEAFVRRTDAPAWLRVDVLPRPPTPSQSLREALWVLAEHNALHFGEAHSATVLARETLAAVETQLPALLDAYEEDARRRDGPRTRAALRAFIGLPQEE